MASLYITTCYGYVFNGRGNPEFKEWCNSHQSEQFVEEYESNKYEIKEKAKICIDDEGRITFVKRLGNKVLCVYGGCMFPVGDNFKVDDYIFVEIQKSFEQMLVDSNTPDVFRNRDDWDFVGTIFDVNS